MANLDCNAGLPPTEDPTAVTWHAEKGNRVYWLNSQVFFTQRHYHAFSIQIEPFHHRNMFISRVTGEQVSFDAVKPLTKRRNSMTNSNCNTGLAPIRQLE